MKRIACFLLATAAFFAAFCPVAGVEEKPVPIPAELRGVWLLRLTSDDNGKVCKSGDGKAVCEVSEEAIQFSRKVDFSQEKLLIKSVIKTDGKEPTYTLVFDSGDVWKVTANGGSITAMIHKCEQEKLVETYRITVRKQ